MQWHTYAPDLRAWHYWWAWHPVRYKSSVDVNTFVWCERVERRFSIGRFEYRGRHEG